MSKPPHSPYPPDVEDDPPPPGGLGELVDAIVLDQDWANERARGMSAQRVEMRRCRLTGAERVVFRDCRMSECDLYGATLKDVLFERCELREATFSTCTLDRVELRGCDLAGARGAEALRGARMTWNDVIENAALFATALGIEVVD